MNTAVHVQGDSGGQSQNGCEWSVSQHGGSTTGKQNVCKICLQNHQRHGVIVCHFLSKALFHL